MQSTPLVTVGVVALNRAWIIDRMLSSIQNQTYPHDKLYVVFVDGVSKDGTAELAKQKLAKSDFSGFEVIVQKCNIPEGRNICREKMRGELLLFWDSDVIMPPNSIIHLVHSLSEESADLMSATSRNVTVNSIEEIPGKLQEITQTDTAAPRGTVKAAMMGQSLLTKRLASTISFDPQLTNQEDVDFCLRARAQGFKIMVDPNVMVLDVNNFKVASSDIYIYMPLKDAMRGIKKKSQVQVYAYDFPESESPWKFFLNYKRYVFYLLYIPAIVLTIIGILLQSIYLALVFPVFALLYTALQIRRRGVSRGIKMFVISIIVGIPNAFWVTVYWFQVVVKGTKKLQTAL